VAATGDSYTECTSSHLTNFALLLVRHSMLLLTIYVGAVECYSYNMLYVICYLPSYCSQDVNPFDEEISDRDNDILTIITYVDVNPFDEEISDRDNDILTIITYVGCAISLAGILITLITYIKHK